jgi:hypothetical protein
MALISVRSDVITPPVVKVFTTFAAQQNLHVATGSAALAAAPANINHLPAKIFVQAAAADVLEFIDTLGNTCSMTFVRAFDGALPFTFAALTANTTVDAVTVAWNVEP